MYIYKINDYYMGNLYVGCTNGEGRKYSVAWTRQQEFAHKYTKPNTTLEHYLLSVGHRYERIMITE